MSKKTRRTRRIRSALLAVSLMMVVAMASVGVTVAWLTDTTDAITNTFTASNIEIELTESSGLNFKMVPGSDIAKDPKVTVKAGSEACWLFVKLEKANDFDKYMEYELAMTDVAGTAAPIWTALDATNHPGVFYCAVQASDEDQTFAVLNGNKVSVKSSVTKAMMDALTDENADKPTLTVRAYACQQANVANVSDAWKNISDAAAPQPGTDDDPAEDNA